MTWSIPIGSVVFIALFIYLAAASEAHAAQLRQVSRGMLVSDAMITRVESLSPQSRVRMRWNARSPPRSTVPGRGRQ